VRVSALLITNKAAAVCSQILCPWNFRAVTFANIRLSLQTIPARPEGFGHQNGHQEIYPGSEYTVRFVPKVKFEIVTSDEQVQAAVKAIVKAARTGKIGDGKVFVLGIEHGIRIRTGQRGIDAV
jgi:nitrogen regulatory protein P-II 1